jgi:hypothetical protein
LSDKIYKIDKIDEMPSYGQRNGVPVNRLFFEHAIETYKLTACAKIPHEPPLQFAGHNVILLMQCGDYVVQKVRILQDC